MSERVDLMMEFTTAVGGITPRTISWLSDSYGVPSQVIYGGACLCGRESVRFDGPYFEPDNDSGAAALIVPCGRRGPGGVMWLEVDDLIAFRPGAPTAWASRLGIGALLGHDAVEAALWDRAPLMLYSTPLAWLQACGDGTVILDWSQHLLFWLGDLPIIVCDSVPLAKRLDAAMRKALKSMPEIRVTSVESKDHEA